jgi:isopentenyl phosphate kinase
MIILKAGGSAITDKRKPCTPRLDVMRLIAEQLRDIDEPVILVHGGGSFGHIPAKQYALSEGYRSPEQLTGLAETKEKMEVLNNIFIKILNHTINVIPLQSSACFITKNKEIAAFFSRPVTRALDLGMTPVLYGDTVFDETLGFCILSGDRIITALSKEFRTRKVIFGTDVDGIYDKDPKKYSDARLIKEFSLKAFSAEIGEIDDVTGGMRGKLGEIKKIVHRGVEVDIINITTSGTIAAAVKGDIHGTRVVP